MLLRYLKERVYDFLVSQIIFRPGLREIYDRHEFFYNAFRSLSCNSISGDYAEFGCYRGETFALAYTEAKRRGHPAKLWAFDSFEGLPAPKDELDDHPVWVAGSMATSLDQFHDIMRRRGVPRGRYAVVPGFYEDTLPLMDQPRDIALAYVDCDMYSSARDVLGFLKSRLKQGMIIAFDDYFCMSASQISGERRALAEVLEDDPHWRLVPFMRYSFAGQAFIVEAR
jgi:hypothetical protein